MNEQDLAKVTTRYLDQGGGPACAGGHEGVDWGLGFIAGLYAGVGTTPTSRTEYFTPGLTWASDIGITDPDCGFAPGNIDFAYRDEIFSHPGDYTRRWRAAPVTPAGGYPYFPDQNTTGLRVPMVSEQGTVGANGPTAYMTGTTTLTDKSGAVVATSDRPGRADDWPHLAPGRYHLTIDAERKSPWSDLATRQHLAWNLDVTDAEEVGLPAIAYQATLGNENRARPNSPQEITLVPQRMDQASSRTRPMLRVSYDDGHSWSSADVTKRGNDWVASFRNPPSGHVSLRTALPGVLDQTTIRAYAIS